MDEHLRILEECMKMGVPKGMENYRFPIGAERFYPKQQELIFFDTVPLPEEQLEKGREKALRQQDKILAIFREHSTVWLTPYQIQRIYEEVFGPILITSVRRSITDMTMRDGTGRLRKGTLGDQVTEKWGTNNNRWKYNENYAPSINPKK